jgi:hypothetical protein
MQREGMCRPKLQYRVTTVLSVTLALLPLESGANVVLRL